ncbi:MarR family transcriptional regulator [Sterolibacterium denitrificans]|uniref:MarR family transcriptional regulator n=1 Tax=Sterolibacterium denitrificans TaxID=157592 RepID=A0A7Z7MV61_9PROT|nr:MarR family transcriptional regulator [Sterolibacterium denitrificans]SMB26049.1 MarR family transcriptional regulator [Sterolibacterium denitrificans]
MAETSDLTKEDYQRLAHFRYRLRCFLRLSESLCQESGITPLQYQLLLQLKGGLGREWASIGELAEQLQAKHHGVVALVDRCVKAGMVERRAGREDRRQVEVHLLPAGDRLVRRIAMLHQDELKLLREEFAAPGWLPAQ